MNTTSPFLNVNTTNFSLNITTVNSSHKSNFNQQPFNSTTKKTRAFFEKRLNRRAVSIQQARESESFSVRIADFDRHKNNSTHSEFEKLMNRVDINIKDHATDAEPSFSHDPQSSDISIPLKGLKEDDFYPKFVTDAKKTIDQILANSIAQEKDWEALAKIFQAMHEYQYIKDSESKNVELMKDSLENFAQVLLRTSITTKAQFLAFKNWVSISSFDSSSAIGFNNLNQAKIYLLKLGEVMSSSNEGIQNLVHSYANVLFRYQFIEKCLENKCIVKQELFTVIEKTFNLCEKFKGQSQYYFIRNALMSFDRILQNTEKATFKNEIIDKLKGGFGKLLHKLASEEKTIVKQLSYLTIKSARGDPTLSHFIQETTVKDIYPYQKEISVTHMKVNITSALDWNHDLMKQLSHKLQRTYSIFIEKFGSVLGINAQEVKCNLYIAKDKELYEIFNFMLLGKSTGNGGVTECVYEDRSCIPSAAMYAQGNKIWNLEHEFNHILLHVYAGLKVNHPMDKFGKFGRLDWLNEGLSYVLIPNSFMEGKIQKSLIEMGRLPLIKDIIEVEATSQDYARSYSLLDYLLNKQKPILDKILVYIKNEKDDSLKKELENLKFLESDFHAYLMTCWELPESTIKPQTQTVMDKQLTKSSHLLSGRNTARITPEPTISNQEDNQTEGDATAKTVACKSAVGNAAVKTVTYISAAPIALGTIALAVLYWSSIISKQQSGDGRGGHSGRGANRRRDDEPSKHPEIVPLKQGRGKSGFFRKDSNPSQRKQGNIRV
ncbi:MAG TPA: collagenase [Candidatus Rhabdochlamydia sp.]|jgi:hypothetical protein|nr:collagenase [Candidatus Rhabdochlamydia sp.]